METEQPTKQRALPRVWARFFKLKRHERHYEGSQIVYKSSPFTSRGLSRTFWHWPWTRVKTTVFVRDVLSGGKSAGGTVTEAARESYPVTGTVTSRLNAHGLAPSNCRDILPETTGGATLTTGPVS